MKKDIILYRDKSVKFTKRSNLKLLGKEVLDNPEVDYALLNNYSPNRGNLYNIVDQATRFDEKKEQFHFDVRMYHQMEDCPCDSQIEMPMNFTTNNARDRVSVSQQIAELLQCSYYCNTHCQIGHHPELDALIVQNDIGIREVFPGDVEKIAKNKKVRKQLRHLGIEPFHQIYELHNQLIAIYHDKWMYGDISEFALPFSIIPDDFDYIYFPLEVLRSGYLLTHREVNLLLATEKISIQILAEIEDEPRLRLIEPETDDNDCLLEEIVIDSGYDTSRFNGLLYTSTFLMHILGMENLLYPENKNAIRIEVMLLNGVVLKRYISSKDFKPFSLVEEVLKLLEKQLAYNMRYL